MTDKELLERAVYCSETAVLAARAKEPDDFIQKFLTSENGKKICQIMTENSNLLSLCLKNAKIIASAVDKRGVSGKKNLFGNIFNRFGESKNSYETYYLPISANEETVVYPEEKSDEKDAESGYKKCIAFLKDAFSKKPPDMRELNDLRRLTEISCSYVPATDPAGGLSDISLYDHAKLTAAIAANLYGFIASNHAEDGFEWLNNNRDNLKSEELFLLVSGDISGVQQFIYTIPSKGALKSLRGRSFYLDILLENAADELLLQSGLSRSNRLYVGGGHFYLLAPNTKEQTEILQKFGQSVNDWFLKHFGSRLYLAVAYTKCTAAEFMGLTPMGAGAPFERVGSLLSQEKMRRYSKEQLKEMFSPNSKINKNQDDSRECGICHTSSVRLEAYNDEDEALACVTCRNLYKMGNKMLNGDAFFVSEHSSEDATPIPGFERNLYLIPGSVNDVNADALRIYVKNKSYVNIDKAVYINLGDYSAKENGIVMSFSDLAQKSGGINRMGVMRADVDNLGAAFIAGFQGNLATITRTGALSRELSLFFKKYINDLSRGNTPVERFFLFNQKKDRDRAVHVVYSGGDDLFFVGAWDDLIELAVDIRRAFAKFTNGKLTFSAGLGFFGGKFPVSAMARLTGELEDAAKDNVGDKKNKDSVALFGASSVTKSQSGKDKPTVFFWDEFIEKVCGEKLKFISSHFVFPQENDDKTKIPIGKSALYRILSLLTTAKDKGGINLARFAYVLARLEPKDKDNLREVYKEVRGKFYEWYKRDEDRKHLKTAVELVIYNLREQ